MTRLTIRASRPLGRALHQADQAEPLPWPNGCEFVTTRDTLPRLPRAPHARVIRRPVHVTAATRDRATGQGLGTDDDWSRISHLSSSGSAGHRRAAAVQLSRQTPPRALQIQVRMWVLRERLCTLCRGYDTGDLGTDSGDHATVLTDGFHANWPSRGATRCPSATFSGILFSKFGPTPPFAARRRAPSGRPSGHATAHHVWRRGMPCRCP